MIVPKPDTDPLYRDEILGLVQRQIDKHPRSGQVQIGPSEVGDCPRKVAWKLAYGGDTDREGGWAAQRGTIIHAWLDHTFRGTDRFMPDGSQRFFSDMKLKAVSPLVNGGTLDLYDALQQTVIDWKCPGEWTMRAVRNGLPSETYYVQAQIYARGLEEMGHPVTRTCLAFLPACGDDLHSVARGALFLFWPYDRSVSEAAFASVERIQNMLDVAPVRKVLDVMETKSSYCASCPAHVSSGDRRAFCPGVITKPVRTESADPFK